MGNPQAAVTVVYKVVNNLAAAIVITPILPPRSTVKGGISPHSMSVLRQEAPSEPDSRLGFG